jgi:hypothetical protein
LLWLLFSHIFGYEPGSCFREPGFLPAVQISNPVDAPDYLFRPMGWEGSAFARSPAGQRGGRKESLGRRHEVATVNPIRSMAGESFRKDAMLNTARPGRICQLTIAEATKVVLRYGLDHVGDMNLFRCFDRSDH